MDIDAFLGDFAPQLEMANLSSFAIHECRQITHKGSWKLALRGYLESYHIRVVHAASIVSAFVGNLSTHGAFAPDKQPLLTPWPSLDIPELAHQADLTAPLGPPTPPPN